VTSLSLGSPAPLSVHELRELLELVVSPPLPPLEPTEPVEPGPALDEALLDEPPEPPEPVASPT